MNRLFLTEKEVFDYVKECGSPKGDLGMYCQWRPGYEASASIQPLGDAVWESDPNDWWWYIDHGHCRVWQSHPSDDEINVPWPDIMGGIYNMKNGSSSSSAGIGFTGLLQIVFIVLKLCGIITWSWLWVLSPIWISLVFVVIILVGIFAYALRK